MDLLNVYLVGSGLESQNYFFFFFFFFGLSRAALVPYGGFEARGQIRAAAPGLHHSIARSEPRL